jgi:hypothetical protein
MELYRKIYIKSEADLPKEVGSYFVYFKDVGEDIYDWVLTNGENPVEEYWNGQFQEDYWINTFDWYLQPIEITDSDIEAWADKIERRGCSYYNGLMAGAKAMRDNEIKHIQ